jgi:tRNA threonylcarbamoyl adenosine modification protein (Sua5/YciO/YrdC/YwlC family)
MPLLRLDIDPHRIEPRKIRRAVEILHEGGVAAYPTDTVYALGCAIDARHAVERIYRAKQMDAKQRLALLCPDVSAAAGYAFFSQDAYRLMRRILPGPYTIVLTATRHVPRTLLDKKRRQVGIRVPDHPITLALVKALGRPLLTSSAVPPGEVEPCASADQVEDAFASHIDLLIDGGPTAREPSTVIALDEDGIEILRHGLGPIEPLTG